MDGRTDGYIIIVDDDEAVRDALSDVVHSLGYRVQCAGNGIEALELVSRSKVPPDLVVLDVAMPGLDGISFARALKAHGPTAQTPVILVSGNAHLAVRAKHIGAAAHLKKPLAFEAVAGVIRRVMETVTTSPPTA